MQSYVVQTAGLCLVARENETGPNETSYAAAVPRSYYHSSLSRAYAYIMCNTSHLFNSVSFSLSLSPVSLFLTDLPGHLVIANIRQERRATPPSLFPWNVVGRGFFTPHPFAQLLIPFQCRRLRAWGSLDREKLAYTHVITREKFARVRNFVRLRMRATFYVLYLPSRCREPQR